MALDVTDNEHLRPRLLRVQLEAELFRQGLENGVNDCPSERLQLSLEFPYEWRTSAFLQQRIHDSVRKEYTREIIEVFWYQ